MEVCYTFDNRNYLLDSDLGILEQELDTVNFFGAVREFNISLRSIKEIEVRSNFVWKIVLPTYREDEVISNWEKVSNFKKTDLLVII